MPTALVAPEFYERLDRLALVSRRRLIGFGKGDRRSVRRGTSLEFIDYRAYASGDDPRQVDWNVYGRSGSLFVKLFEEEEVLTVHLLLDTSASMDWGSGNKLLFARRLAAALGYISLVGATRLHVISLADDMERSFGPAWGRRQMSGLLTFLDAAEGRGETDLDRALRSYALRAREPGLAILISDLLTPKFELGIRRLLDRHFELVVLQVLAPEEAEPPMSGDLTLIDRESGTEVPITLNQEAVERYRRRFAEWSSGIERFCGRHQVVFQRLLSDERLEHVLFDTLRRRGVLR
ncbi:MAG TPA: DUF58 domain-containing protein [Chloroflexota bacterium]|nr:DUF58 domain-containing protein [Chloroflexota bacterium]